MVQLNTTYDKDLKQRVFVLKGEETYARTTDVLASLVTDYEDCNTHKDYARVGIEISVLRNFGDGFIYIYDNDVCLHSYDLPWFDEVSEMESYYDPEVWGDKGVVYSDGKLLIGTDEITTSGFNIAYDVEHNIKVVYSGGYKSGTNQTEKYCLGSSSELLTFEMPTPELFDGTLTFTSGSDGVYDISDTLDDLAIKYTSNGSSSNDKTIKIYEGNTLLKDNITVHDDTSTTVSLGTTLSQGKHTLRAVFMGDDRSTYTETTLDVSIGYQVLLTSYPTTSVEGVACDIGCMLLDYFNDPVVGGEVICVEDGGVEPISPVATTDETGSATIHQCYLSTNDCYVNYDSGNDDYYSVAIPTNIVTITDLSLSSSEVYIGNLESTYVTGNVACVEDASGLLVAYNYRNTTKYVTVNSGNTFRIPIEGVWTSGDKDLTVSCAGLSKTKTIHNVLYYWKQGVKEINKDKYELTYGNLSEKSGDYTIHPYEYNSNAVLRFNDASLYTTDYEISFKVTMNMDDLKIGVGRYKSSQYYVEGSNICTPTRGSIIRIVRDDGVKKVYLDGIEVFSQSVSSGYPVIYISSLLYNSIFSFNELIIKKA